MGKYTTPPSPKEVAVRLLFSWYFGSVGAEGPALKYSRALGKCRRNPDASSQSIPATKIARDSSRKIQRTLTLLMKSRAGRGALGRGKSL